MLAVALLTIVAVSFHHRRATPIQPLAIGRPVSPRLRSPAEKAANPPRQKTGSVQIPIASDALPSHIFRGFLLWRFAYAGPGVCAAPPAWGRHPQTFTEVAIPSAPIMRTTALHRQKRAFQVSSQLVTGALGAGRTQSLGRRCWPRKALAFTASLGLQRARRRRRAAAVCDAPLAGCQANSGVPLGIDGSG
jgi:hypothetical protein